MAVVPGGRAKRLRKAAALALFNARAAARAHRLSCGIGLTTFANNPRRTEEEIVAEEERLKRTGKKPRRMPEPFRDKNPLDTAATGHSRTRHALMGKLRLNKELSEEKVS